MEIREEPHEGLIECILCMMIYIYIHRYRLTNLNHDLALVISHGEGCGEKTSCLILETEVLLYEHS